MRPSSAAWKRPPGTELQKRGTANGSAIVTREPTEAERAGIKIVIGDHFLAKKWLTFLAFMMAEYARRDCDDEDANDEIMAAKKDLLARRDARKRANFVGVSPEEVHVPESILDGLPQEKNLIEGPREEKKGRKKRKRKPNSEPPAMEKARKVIRRANEKVAAKKRKKKKAILIDRTRKPSRIKSFFA